MKRNTFLVLLFTSFLFVACAKILDSREIAGEFAYHIRQEGLDIVEVDNIEKIGDFGVLVVLQNRDYRIICSADLRLKDYAKLGPIHTDLGNLAVKGKKFRIVPSSDKIHAQYCGLDSGHKYPPPSGMMGETEFKYILFEPVE